MIAISSAEPSKTNLTKAIIDDAACPPEKDRVYLRDGKTPGLALLITSTGAKSYYLYRKINGRPERVLLGKHPAMVLDQARRKAAELNGLIARGINPNEQKRKAKGDITLADVWASYTGSGRSSNKINLKPSTLASYTTQYDLYLAKWAKRTLPEITSDAVLKLHRKIGKEAPYQANRVLALLSALFNHAKSPEGFKYTGENPTKGITRFREKTRERFLAGDELPRFFAAVDEEPDESIQDFFKLLLFTGARRGNVQAMKWEDVNLDRATWTIPDTKNNAAHTVHLSAPVLEILKARKAKAESAPLSRRIELARRQRARRAEWVFPSKSERGHLVEPKGAWARILERAKLKDLRPHDLRRSLGSWQAATGASLPVIGKSLGHKNQSTTQIYARLNLDPVKVSVDAATAAMLAAVNGAAKVEGGSK